MKKFQCVFKVQTEIRQIKDIIILRLLLSSSVIHLLLLVESNDMFLFVLLHLVNVILWILAQFLITYIAWCSEFVGIGM